MRHEGQAVPDGRTYRSLNPLPRRSLCAGEHDDFHSN